MSADEKGRSLASLHQATFESEWAVGSNIGQVASAAPANLVACSLTPVFPPGAVVLRAILIASIHADNQSANQQNVLFKIQGQKAGGGYTDLLDLTAQAGLAMVPLIGGDDQWAGSIDVTAKVNASAVQYDFRFVVTDSNAGAVNFTQNFTLVLVYTI